MKIEIPEEFDNWNEYIKKERANKYWANNIKQKEKEIVKYYSQKLKYTGKYPIRLTITKYFKDKRQDLDNLRIKGVLDSLVSSGVIKNDNLNCITEIVLRAEFGDKKGMIIEMEEKRG